MKSLKTAVINTFTISQYVTSEIFLHTEIHFEANQASNLFQRLLRKLHFFIMRKIKNKNKKNCKCINEKKNS